MSQGAEADPSTGLREWLDDLPEGNDTLFAAFDTRVDMVRRLPGSAAKAVVKVARTRGYQLLTRPESFYVQDVPGPLLNGEVRRAEVWGAQLAGVAERRTAKLGLSHRCDTTGSSAIVVNALMNSRRLGDR